MRVFHYLLLFFSICLPISAQKQNNQIKELENKRKAMLEKIELTNKLINESRNSEKQSERKLNLITTQINNRKQLIQTLNEEIATVNRQIKEKEESIAELDKELKTKQDRYAKSIRMMARKNKTEDKLMFILSAQNLSQTYRRIRYLREYSLSQHSQGKEIKNQKACIETEKEALHSIQKEKNNLLDERHKEENELKKEEENNRLELKDIRTKQKGLKSQLDKQRAQAASFDKQIEKLIREEIEAANRKAQGNRAKNTHNAAKDAEKAFTNNNTENEKRVSDTQGGYAMTSTEKALSGSFENNRGRLPLPINGKGVVVGHFGIQQNKQYNKVQTDNIGIDIETTAGTEARSVFDGVVSRVFVLPGYHTSVMIRHGNYLTIYGNLSQVYVKQGDKVNTKQAIGKIFTDTENNHTQLHFQIRRETVKLNPEEWLIH